jgi:hypothetical protein
MPRHCGLHMSVAGISDHLSKIPKMRLSQSFLFGVLYYAMDFLRWWVKGSKTSEAKARLTVTAEASSEDEE